jgi:hypothetical protein
MPPAIYWIRAETIPRHRPTSGVSTVVRYLFLALVVAFGFTLAACRSTKSSARIYEGDGPNIRFDSSHAGGPVSTR